MKLNPNFDKPYITAELKKMDRQIKREYKKRCKSAKYKGLKSSYDEKLKKAAQVYLEKNVRSLKEDDPGKAYRCLKKMGAQPGDCSETSTFTLPNHEAEGLSAEQSAERMAQHFAEISQEFPPLNINLLPDRVKIKLENKSSPPVIEDYEVHNKIKSAKKPHNKRLCARIGQTSWQDYQQYMQDWGMACTVES